MPPMPPVSGALKVQLHWSDENDVGAMTVFHLAYTGGPPSSANCASMAAAISADAAARFATLLHGDNTIGIATVTDLSSDLGGEGTGGIAISGSRSGDALSPATCVVVSKHVARHYRGGHPRSYLPLGTSTDLNSGKWITGFTGPVKVAWDDFINDCKSDGTGCVITDEISVSYILHGAPRVTPQKDTIISTTVPTLIGSQRRRNRKQ